MSVLSYINYIQISSNGLISFGGSFTNYYPTKFPKTVPVIAPYWDDIDMRNKGSVVYNIFSDLNGSEVLRNISTFINSIYHTPAKFEAISAVVIFWEEVCPNRKATCSEVSLA